jgi:hypothetical protein
MSLAWRFNGARWVRRLPKHRPVLVGEPLALGAILHELLRPDLQLSRRQQLHRLTHAATVAWGEEEPSRQDKAL